MNITLSIDEEVLRHVRKIAVDRNSTVTGIVREYLESLARAGDQDAQRAATALQEDFQAVAAAGVGSGGRQWSRDELHER